ncbi:hypothetical protein [Parapedobacter soli]|uniref:hypothetical protein n=1 Tax=Parapedobacter soli TaxID=416955 RepID=UPI0021C64FC5|nr:hypothetical protein [Parapedobacter soli]
MCRKLNIGLGAGMALTYLFTLMGTFAVAKENAVYHGSADAVEYVEAKVFASTAEKLHVEFARLQAKTGSKTIQVMQAPDKAQGAQLSFGKIDSRPILQDLQWFPVTVNPSNPNMPSQQAITGPPSGSTDSGCVPNQPTGTICAIQFDLDEVPSENLTELEEILENLEDGATNYTIQDIIDLGITVKATARRTP